MTNMTLELNRAGQSLWLDNITRELLSSGTLRRYIDELSITGLTSNPTIFDHAMKHGSAYDEDIRNLAQKGLMDEKLFFELALEDLTRAADLFRPVHDRTSGVDGWVSLEVSPRLAYDSNSTLTEARDLHRRAARPNLYIKIPGTREGLPAIESATFAGVPINVTLLFSAEQYVAAADAWLRGIERRIAAGLNPNVPSVASVFLSRWDVATADKVPAALRNRLGLAVGRSAYRSYCELLTSARWLRALNAGARPQRLLFASTGTKDPKASDVLYIEGLVAPLTINTMPENTLKAFADHGKVGDAIRSDGGDSGAVLGEFTKAGVDLAALAKKLQEDGAAAFVSSWDSLMGVISAKATALKKAAGAR
ncbi:MAG TPA: transaldolase [Steroidobacteraceae bacterium]|nr:transaldolase [Steroidobacteraceae bacterium]